MTTVALSAHFDGKAIKLDEPYKLHDKARLVVVVMPDDEEREAWSRFSLTNLSRAYSDNEPEYTEADIRERP